jgi:hypothetical protein
MNGIAWTGHPEEHPVEDTVSEAIALARRVNARVATRLRSWRRPPTSLSRRVLDDGICARLAASDRDDAAFA